MPTLEPASSVEAHTPPCGSSAFVTDDRPLYADYARCVHCGLCLNACPTFRVLGEEMDSPRGRIYQVLLADTGRIAVAETFARHIDRCLDCRACETACPSGVEYGRIVERARAELNSQIRRPWLARWARKHFLQQVLPSRRALHMYAALLRVYQRSGLQALLRRSGTLRALGLHRLERLTPAIDRRSFAVEIGRVLPAIGPRRARVALLAGCMQTVTMAELNRATLRVLQRNGCEVVVPAAQTCCGALQVHAGMRDFARGLARRNIEAFGAAGAPGVDAIITNTAGCGSVLKEYGDLLSGDPRWAEAAHAFAARVRDVTEFLVALGPDVEGLRPLPLRVTYQDPCHLAHAQKIRQAPRQLLRAIPGLKLVEMERADQCCGSAGIYNVIQAEIAARVLDEKMDTVEATAAEVIATANPGCMLQLRAGVAERGTGQRVAHVIELLDASYSPPQ